MQTSRVPPIQRFGRLSPARRGLVVRSAALLTLSSAMVASMPFRRAIAFGSAPLGSRGARSARVEDVLWAVETAARYLPLRTMCIEKGIAAQRLLRRNGRDAKLHYGARTDAAERGLAAHVWVSLDGEIILGGEEASAFAEVACFP